MSTCAGIFPQTAAHSYELIRKSPNPLLTGLLSHLHRISLLHSMTNSSSPIYTSSDVDMPSNTKSATYPSLFPPQTGRGTVTGIYNSHVHS